MNELERFKAVVNFEEPDYYPTFAFLCAPGMSGMLMQHTYEKLLREGLPEDVGGVLFAGIDTWQEYWGTTSPAGISIFPSDKGMGWVKSTRRKEGGFLVTEYETGAVTRSVLSDTMVYSMPHFVSYHVRDRESWEFYKEKTRPGKLWPMDKIREECRKYANRDKPLSISLNGTWGQLRDLMGPEKACTILYDDPELAHDIIDYYSYINEHYLFPIIEEIKPEIIMSGEDISYNHGMLISPAKFREFCAPSYKKAGELAKACDVDMFAVDSDGNIMELVPLLEECGVNAIFPCEVKANNDLFKIREEHPKFIVMGGLEKEVVNDGNEDMIEDEIMSKVPQLLKSGGYFPNLDHVLQPDANYRSICKFMTLLHEVTGNPEGRFPRIK